MHCVILDAKLRHW